MSVGRRVALINCFRQSAAELGITLEVLACDLTPELSAACHAADRAFAVPRSDSSGFIDAVYDIAKENGVALVVPTIDTELPPVAEAAGRFSAAGIRVHVSPPPVIAVVRDKLETARVLSAAGVPTPETFDLESFRRSGGDISAPLFMKPRSGSASRGLKLIQSRDDLPAKTDEPMIGQEHLSGAEYTINMFIDEGGTLQAVVPHRRLSIRAGEVEKGRTERRPDFAEFAEGIVRALPDAVGVQCFQVIVDRERGPKVFEINARFGGGYPLAHQAGATFARWLLEEVAGQTSSANDDWREGVTMLRYDEAIYLE